MTWYFLTQCNGLKCFFLSNMIDIMSRYFIVFSSPFDTLTVLKHVQSLVSHMGKFFLHYSFFNRPLL